MGGLRPPPPPWLVGMVSAGSSMCAKSMRPGHRKKMKKTI